MRTQTTGVKGSVKLPRDPTFFEARRHLPATAWISHVKATPVTASSGASVLYSALLTNLMRGVTASINS